MDGTILMRQSQVSKVGRQKTCQTAGISPFVELAIARVGAHTTDEADRGTAASSLVGYSELSAADVVKVGSAHAYDRTKFN